ncbi:hypothetical protein GH733_019519 [Mirounga leonina]|nr:hypothetical protein GH733_019519 [Mirounga leonina]
MLGEPSMPPISTLPTHTDQSAFSSSGILAHFVVQYDVVMEGITGDVQFYEGYFIHYFAPQSPPTCQEKRGIRY